MVPCIVRVIVLWRIGIDEGAIIELIEDLGVGRDPISLSAKRIDREGLGVHRRGGIIVVMGVACITHIEPPKVVC